jgi:hypothetical protein
MGNRAIRVSRIPVSADSQTRLEERFRERHLAQQRRVDHMQLLRENRELLELLTKVERGRVSERAAAEVFPVRGAGSFDPAGGRPSQALVALRRDGEHQLGADFVARRIATLRAELATLEPPVESRRPEAAVPWLDSFARRVRDRLLSLTAFEVLRDSHGLRADGRFELTGDEFRLGPREAGAVRQHAAELRRDLASLLASTRPDLGLPLLVGMARLLALEETLRLGHWVWLDTFDPDDERVDLSRVRERESLLASLHDETERALATAREHFTRGATWNEGAYAELEAAANRHRELGRARAGSTILRIQEWGRIPTRSAPRDDWLLPRIPAAKLERSRVRAREREADWAARMHEHHAYHLIRKNCVSEIFSTINAAFGGSRAESTRRLGGWIDGGGFDFIPLASAASVTRRYRVSEADRILPWREVQIAQMPDRWWVRLRESNTLTATAYARGSHDSFFLFFTDGPLGASWALRPVAGSLNLVAGLGETAVGLVTAPVNGMRTLRSGLKGALSSLPELAFLNVRKGSYDYVAPQHLDDRLDAAPESSVE